MTEPLISIAIPTYNRRDFMIESLQAIAPQLGDFAEIVVCDNASSDGTDDTLKEFSRNDPRVRSFRNEQNLGPDANTLRCLREARGRFIHLLADDDVLLPGALRRLRSFLLSNNQRLSVVHINFVNFTGAYTEAKLSPPHHQKTDIVFSDKNEFLKRLSVHATLFSATVLRRADALRVPTPEKFVGSRLLQSHLAVACIGRGEQFGILGEPGVAVRGGNSGGYSVYQIFGDEWKKVLFETGIESGLNRSTAIAVYDHTIRTFMRSWAVQLRTRKTRYESSGLAVLLRSTWTFTSAWTHVYPFLLTPAPLLRAVKSLYDKIKSLR